MDEPFFDIPKTNFHNLLISLLSLLHSSLVTNSTRYYLLPLTTKDFVLLSLLLAIWFLVLTGLLFGLSGYIQVVLLPSSLQH